MTVYLKFTQLHMFYNIATQGKAFFNFILQVNSQTPLPLCDPNMPDSASCPDQADSCTGPEKFTLCRRYCGLCTEPNSNGTTATIKTTKIVAAGADCVDISKLCNTFKGQCGETKIKVLCLKTCDACPGKTTILNKSTAPSSGQKQTTSVKSVTSISDTESTSVATAGSTAQPGKTTSKTSQTGSDKGQTTNQLSTSMKPKTASATTEVSTKTSVSKSTVSPVKPVTVDSSTLTNTTDDTGSDTTSSSGSITPTKSLDSSNSSPISESTVSPSEMSTKSSEEPTSTQKPSKPLTQKPPMSSQKPSMSSQKPTSTQTPSPPQKASTVKTTITSTERWMASSKLTSFDQFFKFYLSNRITFVKV